MATQLDVEAGMGGRFVVMGLMLALVQGCAFGPPPFYAHSIAGDIASGLLLPEEGYDIDRAKKRLGYDKPTCKSPSAAFSGKMAPYWNCLVIGSEYTQCPRPFRGDCVSLDGAAYLLQEPDRLERVIDSMAHPCKYLPSPDQIKANAEIPPDDRKWLNGIWLRAKCDTHPDEYPGEVTLQLFEGEKHVKTFVKPAK